MAKNQLKHIIYSNFSNFTTLFNFEACARFVIGSNTGHIFKEFNKKNNIIGRVQIFKKGKNWVRDGGHTKTQFCLNDFLFHNWKKSYNFYYI